MWALVSACFGGCRDASAWCFQKLAKRSYKFGLHMWPCLGVVGEMSVLGMSCLELGTAVSTRLYVGLLFGWLEHQTLLGTSGEFGSALAHQESLLLHLYLYLSVYISISIYISCLFGEAQALEEHSKP